MITFIKHHRRKFFLLFVLYALVTVVIGLSHHPYIDDAGRQISGSTGFAASYARYLSEYASWLVQGSRHLTDLGLTTQLLSALLLTMTAAVCLYLFCGKKDLSYTHLAAALILGINPWFLEVLSFRFDAPYITLSLLVSVLPFLWYNRSPLIFFVTSVLGVFLMSNSYQASSGIYLIMLMTVLFQGWLEDHLAITYHFKKMVIGLMGYALGLLAYLLEMALNPQLLERGDNTTFPPLNQMFSTLLTNYRLYFQTLFQESAKIWLVLAFLLAFVFVIYAGLQATKKWYLASLVAVLYLFVGACLSYGVFAVMVKAQVTDRPRYAYGFSFFLALVLILLAGYVYHRHADKIKQGLIVLFSYYLMSFAFSYASMLYYQNEAFNAQSQGLGQDLAYLLPNATNQESQVIYANSLFKDSPIFLNALANYPILDDLIYSNSLIYWPNISRFVTQTGLNVTIEPFDMTQLKRDQVTVKLSHYHYTIYQDNHNQLYVEMHP